MILQTYLQVRYREIRAMHEELKKRYAKQLPHMPGKTTTRRFDGQFLEQRAIVLRKYFEDLSMVE